MISNFVVDFALGMTRADARAPTAANTRAGYRFQPGIGPHSEDDTVRMALGEVGLYQAQFGVPYPEATRLRCDVCIGSSAPFEWGIEFKMLRFLGDNGKENDNVLMHILSPYGSHNSALSDCPKLVRSRIAARKAIVIFGYECGLLPLDKAIEAFEVLAARAVELGPRAEASTGPLIHPVHARGKVFGWEIG